MNRYDIALKGLLGRAGGTVLRDLTGLEVARWHNVELANVRQRNVDMLGETADGRLVHIELQSTHDQWMALRMAEYALAIRRQFRRYPEQVVLYVGQARLRMKGRIAGPHLNFECRIVDFRELDAALLIESRSLVDNVVSVLARFRDARETVRNILERIAESDPEERPLALAELLILAALRKLDEIVIQEAKQMPILSDLMDNTVLGREFRRGLAQGREQGLEEGREEGIEQARRDVLLQLIRKRFRRIPAWAREKISGLSAAEVGETTLRVLDARDLEELLRPGQQDNAK